ncbi:hypothetical protein DQ353_12525 [Arthrobacter sp. AQ5-05]|uniref:hypothetical protein n=1 Tax=Arthrobacter sp. AQ5-05 TaxID=2184581 RepID=UPI000DCBFA2D|nr:hypothetical protein [Arthrobacter sp. AQ5-05]RAX48938.1 hypothetical protein DQ353_12525 [Arthrobacter sp. AQ5-05]
MQPTRHCDVCQSSLEGTRPTARYCSDACKMRAYRRRLADRQEIAADLLRRQTRAIIDGADASVLAAIARDAERLLG